MQAVLFRLIKIATRAGGCAVHFHCCVIDGLFESATDTVVAPDEAPNVTFHAALAHELDAAAFADVQARVRTRVLRAFVRRGLIDKDDATEMRAWAHDGGFSVDGSVRIEGADRTALEPLLRYCARPPFALEHLHQRDAEHLVYRNPKPVRGTAPGTRPAALVLTPLELITKIAALVPPPRAHRHRYYGVLAPNAPLRAVVTELAPAAVAPAPTSAATREEPRHRAVAWYLWAMLLARSGAEDFLMGNRRLTQTTRVEDAPECRIGFPILWMRHSVGHAGDRQVCAWGISLKQPAGQGPRCPQAAPGSSPCRKSRWRALPTGAWPLPRRN